MVHGDVRIAEAVDGDVRIAKAVDDGDGHAHTRAVHVGRSVGQSTDHTAASSRSNAPRAARRIHEREPKWPMVPGSLVEWDG